jgi:signal transduction histidine kinase
MILLVEDDTAHAELIRRAFAERGAAHDLLVVGTLAEAEEHLSDPGLQLVLADFLLPDGTCLELLPGDLDQADHPTVVMTSHGNEQVAVDAMKAGALDYVVKSESSLADMPHIAERAMREWSHILERKKLEAQLLEAQKLEAIGTLAGGIAHDFNNLLMGIQGNASLMLLDVGVDSPHYEQLRSIEDLVKSGADLTRQLLGFARGGRYEVAPIDINALIQETSEVFGRTKKQVRIHRSFQRDRSWVQGDRTQLEQILLNLFVNAWQAMPEGGDLDIQTEAVRLAEDEVRLWRGQAGDYVRVLVADSGVGMDAKTQTRIFEPFFSTKGTGSGLGLSSVYGIVKNHGGHVGVHSSPGKGSTFEILLPACKPAAPEKSRYHPKIERGSETILLVDDEPAILKVSAALLRRIGYTVLTASSGREATTVFAEQSAEVDLVILDMIMPGSGARGVLAELQKMDPEVTVLLCSGYGPDQETEYLLGRGCVGFIQKPFDLEAASHQIRNALDRRPS